MPISTVRPAAFGDATRLRNVAVMPFNGERGSEIAARLEATLAEVSIDGETYFRVSGAQQTSRSIAPTSGRAQGVEVQQAVSLGRQLGVEGVYAGA